MTSPHSPFLVIFCGALFCSRDIFGAPTCCEPPGVMLTTYRHLWVCWSTSSLFDPRCLPLSSIKLCLSLKESLDDPQRYLSLTGFTSGTIAAEGRHSFGETFPWPMAKVMLPWILSYGAASCTFSLVNDLVTHVISNAISNASVYDCDLFPPHMLWVYLLGLTLTSVFICLNNALPVFA